MEVIRRGRALLNSGERPRHEILQVATLEDSSGRSVGSASTPVTVLSSERCFEPIPNITQEADGAEEERSNEALGHSYVEVYIRLLTTVGIIPYKCRESGQRNGMTSILRKVGSCK